MFSEPLFLSHKPYLRNWRKNEQEKWDHLANTPCPSRSHAGLDCMWCTSRDSRPCNGGSGNRSATCYRACGHGFACDRTSDRTRRGTGHDQASGTFSLKTICRRGRLGNVVQSRTLAGRSAEAGFARLEYRQRCRSARKPACASPRNRPNNCQPRADRCRNPQKKEGRDQQPV